MKDSIDRLTTSDYKSAMVLFNDILISITNNIYPELADVKTVYVKAVDGYQKLDDQKIEEKLELIKIQMFCTIYTNCYDKERDTLIAFQNVSEDRKNIIHEIFTERLKDLQNLSERNYLNYYSKHSFTTSGNLKYQKMVDAMDHIKKISYSHMIIKDTIYQMKEFAVKVWSLKSYMVPEGEDDALSSLMNIMTSADDENVTIQASIVTDKESTWFLKIHLPSTSDYEEVLIYLQVAQRWH